MGAVCASHREAQHGSVLGRQWSPAREGETDLMAGSLRTALSVAVPLDTLREDSWGSVRTPW